ncbi:MAG: hypothetical protein Tsb0020_34330 [Haliangiales bacterium]
MSIPNSYPEPVRVALQRLLDELQRVQSGLVGGAVYGSLARGDYHQGEDIGVVLVFERLSSEVLTAVRGPLRAAWRAVRVRPFLVTRDELPRLADVFPVKIEDMVAHHALLFGEDPFVGIVVEAADLRLRVEQQLRNHVLRLRRHYIYAGDDAFELGKAVVGSAQTLGVELTALLRVCGHPAGAGTLASARAAASDALELDDDVLSRLQAVADGSPDDDMRGLFFGLIAVLERAVEVVDAVEVAR